MPPQLLPVGIASARGPNIDPGVEPVYPQLNGSGLMALDTFGRWHFVPNFYGGNTSINAAVGAGASVTLIAAAAAKLWVLRYLTIAISVAGVVQFLDNGNPLINLNLLANQTFVVPIPPDGLWGSNQNAPLQVKNTQAVAVDITVSFNGGTVTY